MKARASLRTVLDRLGLMGVVREWRGRISVAGMSGGMKFPTFSPEVQRAAIATSDYGRYASLALAIHRVEIEDIPGAFAEVGVYQGATSRFILDCAPLRPLYLFDTFEGFPVADREPENIGDTRFQDTSESVVRGALGNTPNLVIRNGRFPESGEGLEGERFALVMLDLDVYNPTLAGLEFFYPRLSPGGYLIVHDFNSPESNSACRRAVTRFMADKVEHIIELPDVYGSALFRKS